MRTPADPPSRTVVYLEAVILCLGTLVRLKDYLSLRSLWLDEAMLARNILDRAADGLFRPLDHDQAAPVGFLAAQKLVISLFGSEEWAFRLVPTALGVWSLFLFARLSRQLVGPAAGLTVLPLLAFNPYLVYATNKQYPVDLWAGLFLFTLLLRVVSPDVRRRDLAALAVTGAGLVWVSHPLPLVAAGLGTAVILGHAAGRRYRHAAFAIAAAGCWLISFAAVYLICFRHVRDNNFLLMYWRFGFPPPDAGLTEVAGWAGKALFDSFNMPTRVTPSQLGVGLAVLGMLRLGRTPVRLGLFVLPVVVVFGAALARLYPFQYRLITILVPFYLWLIAAGLDGLASSGYRIVRVLWCAGLVALLWHPGLDAKRGFGPTPRTEESREVLQYVADWAKPGDVLYVHLNARHTFAYYQGRIALNELEIVTGETVPPDAAARQVRDIPAGRRVWVFHSELRNGACPVTPLTREELLTAAGVGRVALARKDAPGVCVALFGPPPAAEPAGR